MSVAGTSTPTGPFDAGEIAGRLRRTFRSGRTRPAPWRSEQLAGLRRMMTECEDELLEALRLDLGRPRLEAFAADIGHTKAELRHLHRHFDRWMRPTRVRVPLAAAPGRATIQPEPLGVALVIAPWNYPIQLLVEPVAAALAAGNCVVAKPSELAPASSSAMARLLPRYVDPDALAVVEGGVEETTQLLDQQWDHIFFTGSTSVGRIVAEAAARHLTPTTLELGGKSPTYVHVSADVDVAARRIAWGKMLNAGQTCIAPDYVLADRPIQDELVARLAAHIEAFYDDDPRNSTSFARIVNDRHLDRLRKLVEEARSDGTIVAGGTIDATARFVAPTIVVDPSPEGSLMTDEIFGPVLPVLAVDGPADAIDRITRRAKPLALYIFAEDDDAVDAVVNGTSSGGVCVNQTLMHLVPPGLPFGGVGDSGTGSYHGKAGFDAFSHHKSVLRKPTRPDLSFLYPPYGRVAERFVRLVMR